MWTWAIDMLTDMVPNDTLAATSLPDKQKPSRYVDRNSMRLSGLLSFPLTPFTADDKVDLDVFAEHVTRQVEAGPAGLFVACGTGEYTALSLAEYREVVAAAVRVAAGRVPVFAGTGGGPQQARDFALAAAES